MPDEITSVGRLLNIPPLPDVPEPLRGRSVVVVEAIYIGDEAERAELIAPLRAFEPDIDTFATIPASALTLDAAYLMFAVGIPMSPEIADGIERDVSLLQRALARWDAGRMYLNFAEQPRSGRSLFGEDGYARLRRLKTEIDPDNLFHANHQVEPADQGRRRADRRRIVDSQRRAA